LEAEKAILTRELLVSKPTVSHVPEKPVSDLSNAERATIEQIVMHLPMASRMFQINFLLTYQSFTTPSVVLRTIASVHRYNRQQPNVEQHTSRCVASWFGLGWVCMLISPLCRLVNFLELWITRFHNDMDTALTSYFAALIDDNIQDAEIADHLRTLLRTNVCGCCCCCCCCRPKQT
jgi:hypothetical protein